MLNPAHLRDTVSQEIVNRVTEESISECSSPIVILSKPDQTIHACVDFLKVNAVSVCLPSPRDE